MDACMAQYFDSQSKVVKFGRNRAEYEIHSDKIARASSQNLQLSFFSFQSLSPLSIPPFVSPYPISLLSTRPLSTHSNVFYS